MESIKKSLAYKPSMFNYYVIDDSGDLIIYNSYLGGNSIKKVGKENREAVEQWLNTDGVILSEAPYFKKMYDYGFFVLENTDERLRREMRIMEYVMSNKLVLVIHTTKNCNFRCQYCYQNFEDVNMGTNVQKSIVDFIRKNINNFSGIHINWFGGEPLLAIDVIENISKEVIKICKEVKKPYSSAITSNGYLLTPKNIRILLESKVSNMTITVDGLRDSHDKSRVLSSGLGTHERIINNLIYIRDHIKTKALAITLRSNVTKEIMSNLIQTYSYYDSLFGNDGRFTLFARPVCDWGGESVKSLEKELFEDSRFYKDFFELLSKNIKTITYYRNFEDLFVGGVACSAKRLNKYTISVDGKISKCDDIHSELLIGELENNGFMRIEHDRHISWLINEKREEKCDKCPFSCACFRDSCPKNRVFSGELACGLNQDEVSGLLKLIGKSIKLEVI